MTREYTGAQPTGLSPLFDAHGLLRSDQKVNIRSNEEYPGEILKQAGHIGRLRKS